MNSPVIPAVAPNDRIESIDAIRGIALFGVLLVNLVTEFRVSIFQQFLPSNAAGFDLLVDRIVFLGFESKAFSLFALLFGVGLAIQFERLSTGGRPLYWLARRLAVLLGFGLIHLLLIWNGDILTEYAVAGFLVLPLLRLRNSTLLVVTVSLLAVYVVGPSLYALPWPSVPQLQRHVASASEVYGSGSFGDVWRFSHAELPLILVLHVRVLPRTLALFVLGILLWRVGFLKEPQRHAEATAGTAFSLIVVGAALTKLDVALAPVALAVGYGGILVLLSQWPPAKRLLSQFAPMGRMAFTNYVLQSFIFGFIFFGYGLGQFGAMSTTTAIALGVAVYAAELALSKWWLGQYRFGPIEWLWRTLMYGVSQPMRNVAL